MSALECERGALRAAPDLPFDQPGEEALDLVVMDDPQVEYVRVDPSGGTESYDLRFDNDICFGSGIFTYRRSVVARLDDWQQRLGGCSRAGSDCASMLADPLLASDGSPYATSPVINAGQRLNDLQRLSPKENARFPNPSLLD